MGGLEGIKRNREWRMREIGDGEGRGMENGE